MTPLWRAQDGAARGRAVVELTETGVIRRKMVISGWFGRKSRGIGLDRA